MTTHDDERKQAAFIAHVRVTCLKNSDLVFNRLICIKFSYCTISIHVIKINAIELMRHYVIAIMTNLNVKYIRVIRIRVWNAPKHSNLEISIGNGVCQNTGSSC